MSKIFSDYNFVNKPDINEKPKPKIDKKKRLDTGKSIPFFEELLINEDEKPDNQELNYNSREKLDLIEELLKDIGKQGEILKKSKNLEDLDRYKRLIKAFITEILDHIEKKEKKTLWDKRKKEKITKVHLVIINKELEELTAFFFEEQQNTLAIASKIDKIEGILIDMIS